MENIVFNLSQMHLYGAAFYDFLRLRKSFFVDRLGWGIPHDHEVEMDQYDNPRAWYSLVLRDGEVVAGVRGLPTTGSFGSHTYMLRDAVDGKIGTIPSDIMAGPVASPHVWECTRIVLSDDLATQAERSEALQMMCQGLVEVAAKHGATEFIGLSHLTFVRAMRAVGIPAERQGQPWLCAEDGRQYAVMRMPFQPMLAQRQPQPQRARAVPGGLPAATHRPQPMAVHAPVLAPLRAPQVE